MRLVAILALCWSMGAWGATFYIDPTVEAGGVGSEADPFANWSEVTWTAGNTYYQKAGTTANDTGVNIGTTGTSGNVITLGAYDTSTSAPYAIIDCAGAGANGINSQGKAYIRVENIKAINCTNLGMQFTSNVTRAASNITLSNVRADSNTNGGVVLNTAAGSDPAAATSILIEDCAAVGNGGHGCAIETGATDPIMRRCTASGNSLTKSGWGCYISPFARTINAAWTLVSGTTYNRTVNSSEGIDAVYFASRATAGPYKLTEGTFGSLAANEWAQSTSTLQINAGENPSSKNVVTVIGPSTGGRIEDSVAYEQSDAFDGTGIGCDIGAEDCTMLRNRSYDNPVFGFECNICESPTVASNLAWGNGAVGLSLTTMTGTATVSNNVLANNTTTQIRTRRTYTGQTINLRNNIFYGGAAAVTVETNDGTVSDDYSRYFGQTGTAYSGLSAGSNSSSVNPQFIGGSNPQTAEGFKLQPTSPLIRAGTCYLITGCVHYDYRGYRGRVLPDIGAYQRNE